MNREIKFRAFDDGKMIYEKDITHLSLIDNDILRLAKFWCNIRNDAKVMQFTGIKDKNEKEIYEGDILQKWETDYVTYEENDYEGEIPLMVVKKDVATMSRFPSYWLENEQFGYEGEDLESPSNWEIIGNIYDNPDLLSK